MTDWSRSLRPSGTAYNDGERISKHATPSRCGFLKRGMGSHQAVIGFIASSGSACSVRAYRMQGGGRDRAFTT